ncbi:succinyl-diaminopimelate desuccinylase [Alkalilimnicola ehrlichii]|uniref:succinyl-diaminopimelate desuccinylase n=1 Tax=Alkalilimnicola ehrlichii TaxID=351052 RepID=UPI003B9FF95D
MSETLELASALIARRSVTPMDAGCQQLLAERLRPLGFDCERLDYGEVSNLWARRGQQGPVFCFAGHTDVVPPGPEAQWRHPPFQPVVEEGLLYGRGAADMKGSVAAFVTALERYLAGGHRPRGSLALLITSDEEGPAVDGTRHVVETLSERGERIDWCLVGEPSSTERVGDVVKVGRRGSLNGRLTVRGDQGHVAYPHLARNPVHQALAALDELVTTRWDEGNDHFPPTSFQISNVQAGTGATNVIPGELEVTFNFRFSTEVTADELQQRVEAVLDRHGLDGRIDWSLSGEPFLTAEGELVAATQAAVRDVCGDPPVLSTSGGTSDGRFIAPTGAQVLELGPVNATIHKVNEHVRAADLDTLSRIYEGVLRRLLG